MDGGARQRGSPAPPEASLDLRDPAVDLETSGFAVFHLPALVGVDGFAICPADPDFFGRGRPLGGLGRFVGPLEGAVCGVVTVVFGFQPADGWSASGGGSA